MPRLHSCFWGHSGAFGESWRILGEKPLLDRRRPSYDVNYPLIDLSEKEYYSMGERAAFVALKI